ncbi:hypothetical protein E2C01_073156 [Portunus trituberculatus]|uniref:Zonadhesin n=1 Tax=Portunus trituberculatus TaxID=210409 RepID=A0A5B7I4G4_PORTR|nr:hypothetical protein [Portunus trituberculatus]
MRYSLCLAATMLRALLSCCLLGLTLAAGYDAPQSCAPSQNTFTVTNTHVETAIDTVTVYDYFMNHKVLDVTSVVLVPSPLVPGQTVTPLPVGGVPTTTTTITSTLFSTKYQTMHATAVTTTTSRVVATKVQVVSTVTLTMTAVVPHPVTETLTTHDSVTALSTVTVTTETTSARVKIAARFSTLMATSEQVVPVPATTITTSTTTSTVEATVTLTNHELVTLCYSPMITYQH